MFGAHTYIQANVSKYIKIKKFLKMKNVERSTEAYTYNPVLEKRIYCNPVLGKWIF